MKKFTAVLLLFLVGYYLGGFYLHFLVKQKMAEDDIYANLSATVPSEGEVVFSIPMPLYGSVDRDFEKKEGEFYFKGKYYALLGTKIENNTLMITCMANAKAKILNEDLFEFIQENIVSENHSKGKSKTTRTLKLFMPEFASFSKKTTIFLYEWLPLKSKISEGTFSLTHQWVNNSTPPPDFA